MSECLKPPKVRYIIIAGRIALKYPSHTTRVSNAATSQVCVLASSFGTRIALTNAATRRKPDNVSSEAGSVDRAAAVAVAAAGVGVLAPVAAITIFARAVAARAAATVAATVGSALSGSAPSTLDSLSAVGVGEATARLLVHE